jgi:hypothetical protein
VTVESQVWFTRGLERFKGVDPTNSARVLRNLAAAKALLAGRSTAVEELLSQAIADCFRAMEWLGDRPAAPLTWDIVSAELAMAYLSVNPPVTWDIVSAELAMAYLSV